jgi:hypothetical protein
MPKISFVFSIRPGNLENAFPGAQLCLDALFDSRADPRPTKRFARPDGSL